MKRVIVLLFIFILSVSASSIEKDSFIGDWEFDFTQEFSENIVFQMKGNIKYTNDKYELFSNLIAYTNEDMSKYNTKEITFKSNKLIVSSYNIFSSGTWDINGDLLVKEIEHIKFIKNENINQLSLNTTIMDDKGVEMLFLMMKVGLEKNNVELLEIKNISNNEIFLKHLSTLGTKFILKRENQNNVLFFQNKN